MPAGSPPDVEPLCFVSREDGIDIAAYDFGGAGPDLVLVHATGFCAGVLAPLASELGNSFRCWAIDLRAHGRSGRRADGDLAWSYFADDILAVCDALELDRPAAFGHSCGGASLLLAEQARPGSFTSLYTFEPVVVPEWVLPPGFTEVPLAIGARRRRETFPSRDDAFVNFASKPPFGDLDPDALRRYVDDGFALVPDDEGGDGATIRLRCLRLDEAEVYVEGTRHTAFAHLGEVQIPVTLAFGSSTDAFGRPIMEADAAPLPDAHVVELAGLGHFGPLQRPSQVAASVIDALGRQEATPGS